MLPNFTQQILEVTQQINSFIRKKTPIPKGLLSYYNDLLSATNSQESSSSSSSSNQLILSKLSFTNFGNVVLVQPDISLRYLIFQNTGDGNIYFSPTLSDAVGTVYSPSNSFTLGPAASWSSDQKEFIQGGISASAELNLGSSIVIYLSKLN